jgi:hypothetical protein
MGRIVGPVYAARELRSHVALMKRIADRCVYHLRGSKRARPKQKEEFLFEGPYFMKGGGPYNTRARAEFMISHVGDQQAIWARARFVLYDDLTSELDVDPGFPDDALACMLPAFNEVLAGRYHRKR